MVFLMFFSGLYPSFFYNSWIVFVSLSNDVNLTFTTMRNMNLSPIISCFYYFTFTKPNTMRHRILKAASHLFAEHGYVAVTTRMIAEKVGVTHRNVHYHFKTKEALYTEVFRAIFEVNNILTYEVLMKQEPFALETSAGKAYAIQRVITDFFHRHFHVNEEWQRQLILRELFAPSSIFLKLVEDILKKEAEKMTEFYFLLNPEGTVEDAYVWAHMPDTQCLYYMMSESAITAYFDKQFMERLEQTVIKTTVRNMIVMLDLPIPDVLK